MRVAFTRGLSPEVFTRYRADPDLARQHDAEEASSDGTGSLLLASSFGE
ncbi:hypothetical protein [Streptomyces rimosus]|nr:hypothetical protein [Streptomyces rimosus]